MLTCMHVSAEAMSGVGVAVSLGIVKSKRMFFLHFGLTKLPLYLPHSSVPPTLTFPAPAVPFSR